MAIETTETGHWPALRDAQILQKAIRESISTSPDAFLKTIDEVDEKSVDYWEKEIDSSTWAVIQRGEEIVGIGVARWPDREIERNIDPAVTRFIESVWVAPELRGRQLGERLVRFLFEAELEKNPELRMFLLWVFDKNRRAIQLYKRMGFAYTQEKQAVRDGRTELRFQYRLASDNVVVKATRTAVNEAARRADLRQFGVSYRILGSNTA